MSTKTRLDRLTRRSGAGRSGGVLVDLGTDCCLWQGRHYGPSELPTGDYLVVPGTLAPATWDAEAKKVHQAQEALLREVTP